MWLAHFGMRICGGAQLLRSSHLQDHTSIMLIFQAFGLVKGLFGDKHDKKFVHPIPQLLYSKNPNDYLCPISPL